MLMLKDYRQVGQIIEPQKWDVLIRIIDNADAMSMTRGSGSQMSTTMQRTTASSVAAQELRLEHLASASDLSHPRSLTTDLFHSFT
jgi:hypothetical protein